MEQAGEQHPTEQGRRVGRGGEEEAISPLYLQGCKVSTRVGCKHIDN